MIFLAAAFTKSAISLQQKLFLLPFSLSYTITAVFFAWCGFSFLFQQPPALGPIVSNIVKNWKLIKNHKKCTASISLPINFTVQIYQSVLLMVRNFTNQDSIPSTFHSSCISSYQFYIIKIRPVKKINFEKYRWVSSIKFLYINLSVNLIGKVDQYSRCVFRLRILFNSFEKCFLHWKNKKCIIFGQYLTKCARISAASAISVRQIFYLLPQQKS